jgi:mRNA-degrading endonuclease toxin of MazEF toxin-antitoxin module
MNTPQRGDIWFVRLHPSESPTMAVVINTDHDEDEPEYFTVIPHEARPKEFRFDVPITNRYMRDGVFNVQRIHTIMKSQFAQSLGVLAPSDLDAIQRRLYDWLEL